MICLHAGKYASPQPCFILSTVGRWYIRSCVAAYPQLCGIFEADVRAFIYTPCSADAAHGVTEMRPLRGQNRRNRNSKPPGCALANTAICAIIRPVYSSQTRCLTPVNAPSTPPQTRHLRSANGRLVMAQRKSLADKASQARDEYGCRIGKKLWNMGGKPHGTEAKTVGRRRKGRERRRKPCGIGGGNRTELDAETVRSYR